MSRFTGLLELAAAAAAGAVLAGDATAVANTGDVVGSDGKHRYSDGSRFVSDTERQVEDAKRYLTRRLDRGVEKPAVVFDVDDTAEVTYGWEADDDFGFDPVKQQEAIDKGTFVANKPVLELANWAAQRGVKIYFLTGRDEFQGPQSLKNLANEGYPAPAGAFFKPTTTAPDYLPCGLTCTTVQYKAGTRKHIASTGATILADFGDQFSDLEGLP
ncbi:HAD family acid phosphatase [Amycolatopsis sp. NPDC052450]|uniref:HAD family acid phosphatase n=1 Tax=Amycolatopsis sp. NPDC052450 TaxID=3363937 RepID=UPI0037C666D2